MGVVRSCHTDAVVFQCVKLRRRRRRSSDIFAQAKCLFASLANKRIKHISVHICEFTIVSYCIVCVQPNVCSELFCQTQNVVHSKCPLHRCTFCVLSGRCSRQLNPFLMPRCSTMYVDAAYCYRPRSVVC